MKTKPRTPEETYGPALEKALNEFPELDPRETGLRAAVGYQPVDPDRGRFEVPFMGRLFHVHWPQGSVQRVADQADADIATRLLLLHYLLEADGTPLASKWIAFRNLPGGLGYDDAFQRRASRRLAQAFGTDLVGFEKGARALSGERLDFGDASFLFRILPRVWMAAILHLADDEFPAEVNILFDAASSHYLPTEDLAVLGGILASFMIKAAQGR
ncbi:MAG: DUF3786 domain-containing protein [Anaerolineae bacterium]|jgi:hypothetical protein